MEPEVGIEPTTYLLQGGCSTTELHRPGDGFDLQKQPKPSLQASPTLAVGALAPKRPPGAERVLLRQTGPGPHPDLHLRVIHTDSS